MSRADQPGDGGMAHVFDELEAEFEAGLRREAEQDAVTALRAQVGETPLWEQLARRVDTPVIVRAGSRVLHGRIVASYPDFAVVADGDAVQHLVRYGPAVTFTLPSGPPSLQPAPAGTSRRFELALALRELARRREPLRVELADGNSLAGTIEAVGSDYLEVAEHDLGEARREGALRGRRFISFAAVAVITLLPDQQ